MSILSENLIIALEGERYTNDPLDHGGETKYGISKRSYPNVDIKNLTLKDAVLIYTRDYWNVYCLDRISNQATADKIFSQLININLVTAVKIIQKAITSCGGKTIIDGVLGVETIGEINRINNSWLLDRMKILFCEFYLSRIEKDPSQIKYLRGWICRALR